MEHIFLTYDEAAERLGIKPDSVRRRARARKWPRKKGNDGLARVGIPQEVLDGVESSGRPADDPQDNPGTLENAELRVEVRMLRERNEELKEDRNRWRDQAERLASEPRPVVPLFRRLFGR